MSHLEPLQALGEVVGEDVDYSAVVGVLSRHGAGYPRAQPEHLLHVQASLPLLPPFRTPALRFSVGTLASSVGPYVLASLVAFYWPGLLMVGTNSLNNRRLSSEQMAPSSLQSSVAV